MWKFNITNIQPSNNQTTHPQQQHNTIQYKKLKKYFIPEYFEGQRTSKCSARDLKIDFSHIYSTSQRHEHRLPSWQIFVPFQNSQFSLNFVNSRVQTAGYWDTGTTGHQYTRTLRQRDTRTLGHQDVRTSGDGSRNRTQPVHISYTPSLTHLSDYQCIKTLGVIWVTFNSEKVDNLLDKIYLKGEWNVMSSHKRD